MMKYLPLIFGELLRKPARTLLTALVVVIAFLLFGILNGLDAFFAGAIAQTREDRLLVLSRSDTAPLPASYLRDLEQTKGVGQIAYLSGTIMFFQDRKNFVPVAAIDPDRYFGVYPQFRIDPAQRAAMRSTRTGAIVGVQLMEKYRWKVGDQVPLLSGVMKKDGSPSWTVQIVGTYNVEDATPTNRMFINYEFYDEARLRDTGTVGLYIINLSAGAEAVEVAKSIDDRFANAPQQTRTSSEREAAQVQFKFEYLDVITRTVLSAVFLTLLALTANSMMQAFRDRTRELGVLKTLGMQVWQISGLILSESLVICFGAAALGLLAAYFLFPNVIQRFGAPPVALSGNVFTFGFAAAAALAVAAVVAPLIRVKTLTVAEALART